MKFCLDNCVCHKWFTADGHFVCRHSLAEKDFDNGTGIHAVCPLELQLQQIREEKKWSEFWAGKDRIIEEFIKRKNMMMLLKRLIGQKLVGVKELPDGTLELHFEDWVIIAKDLYVTPIIERIT
jgi:hypothetical protein